MTNDVLPMIGEKKVVALGQLRGVSHDFAQPNGKGMPVLDDINLEVRAQEVLALLGPTGCGKSTILRIIAGLIYPKKGDVFYHDKPLNGLNPGVAVVFQSFALYPWMTVAQNVEAVLLAKGQAREEARTTARATIAKVGLAGFEDLYPRELSGGMKQRVGIARALSVNPEILLMDEPFSQVDALTAEALRAEVLDIWGSTERNPSSVVLVSHDIKEAVFMADRIVVLGAHPGRVRTIMEINLPRPRDYRSPQLLAKVDKLYEIITGHELPDVPAAVEIATIQPIPEAGVGEIIGLLEYLDNRGGRENLFRIAGDTGNRYGHIIAVVKAAEQLDFIDTPKQMAVLEPTGVKFVRADVDERKRIWGQQLLKMRLIREIFEMVERQEDKELERDHILENIILKLPQENYEKTFNTLIRWAGYGGLLSYDKSRHMVTTKL